MIGDVFPYPCFSGGVFALGAEGVEALVYYFAQAAAEVREGSADEVGQENCACDVGGSFLDVGELAVGRLDLYEVAVFFAEGAVTGESGERKVEQGCEGAQFGGEGVCCAGAEEAAVEVGDGVGEVAGEVGVFLVRAYYVWCCGEGVW